MVKNKLQDLGSLYLNDDMFGSTRPEPRMVEMVSNRIPQPESHNFVDPKGLISSKQTRALPFDPPVHKDKRSKTQCKNRTSN